MTAFPYLVPRQQDIVEQRPAREFDPPRLTLIAQHGATAGGSPSESTRIVTIDALGFLLRVSVDGVIPIDVERIILDRSISIKQFLEFLASLPHEFSGDVLFMSPDGGAYLSSTGRGAGRLLHSLTDNDLDFYLTTNGLMNDPYLRA